MGMERDGGVSFESLCSGRRLVEKPQATGSGHCSFVRLYSEPAVKPSACALRRSSLDRRSESWPTHFRRVCRMHAFAACVAPPCSSSSSHRRADRHAFASRTNQYAGLQPPPQIRLEQGDTNIGPLFQEQRKLGIPSLRTRCGPGVYFPETGPNTTFLSTSDDILLYCRLAHKKHAPHGFERSLRSAAASQDAQ